MTSLMHASRNGYPDVVQLLLSAGVNVNQQDQVCFIHSQHFVCLNFFFFFLLVLWFIFVP